MSLKNKVAHGLKWQAINIVGRQLTSFVVFAVLARLLDSTAFGKVSLINVYVMLVGMIVDQGINTALVQRAKLEPEHLSAAFWFNLACATFLCFSTLVLANPLATVLGAADLATPLRWASFALIINAAASVHSALFAREMNFRQPVLRALLAQVAGGMVGIVLAFQGYGVAALIGQQLASAVAGTCFLWRVSPWKPTFTLSIRHLKELFSVSASVFATDVLWFISSRFDQLIIGRHAGPSVLGQYVVGGKLSDMTRTAVHQPISAVSMPMLSRLQHDSSQMCRAIYHGMELNALVSFGTFAGLAAVAPTLVPLVFGAQWQMAAVLLQLTSLYALVLGLFVYCHPALLASGGPGKYVLINLLSATGSAVACLIGIRFGVPAVSLGLTLNLLMTGSLALFFLKNRISLSPWQYCRPMLVPALAACLMFFAIKLFRSSLGARLSPWGSLSFQVIAGVLIYTVVCVSLGPKSVLRLWEMVRRALIPVPQAP